MQWFVKMKPLAEPAIEAVRDGRIEIIPQRFERTYMHWMENIRDWCISRQLWWGHRIPVWYCENGHQLPSAVDPTACAEVRQRRSWSRTRTCWTRGSRPGCGRFRRWAGRRRTTDLAYFYPTSVLETGYDILFFWVARMIMLGLYDMGDVPFRTSTCTG